MNLIGLMSGTSLDGLDICYVSFSSSNEKYFYEIFHTKTVSYSDYWKLKLKNATEIKSDDLLVLNIEYGEFLAEEVLKFINENNISSIDAISSHGHTIFHQPNRKMTYQIGCGKTINLKTNIKTVHNFRVQDVLLGGQGAPFVPIGDELLFSEFDACLNLGGFSNISFKQNQKRIGFDICPVNIPLNQIANLFGKEYDKNGDLARSFKVNEILLNKLNELEYYFLTSPKSLGIEWFNNNFKPLLKNHSKEEIISTITEHIAIQIAKVINENDIKSILVSGGGAKNTFLIEKIDTKIPFKMVVPDENLIDFKEALLFAFMGYLKLNNKNNVLSSVTGAIKDHSTGEIN